MTYTKKNSHRLLRICVLREIWQGEIIKKTMQKRKKKWLKLQQFDERKNRCHKGKEKAKSY